MRHMFHKPSRFTITRSHWTNAGKSSKKKKTEREIEKLYDDLLPSLKPLKISEEK